MYNRKQFTTGKLIAGGIIAIIILLLQFFGCIKTNAQCPSFIGQPVNNTRPFMQKVAGALQTTFTDSSIKGENNIMEFTDVANKYTFKIFAKQNKVTSISIIAGKDEISQLNDWAKKEFGECIISQAGQWVKYNNFMMVWQDVDSRKRSLTIESR